MAEKEAEIARLASRPAPEPQKVEVAVIPPELADTLSELAARAEALADAVEEKAG
jgi:cell division protein ZapA